MLELLTEKEMAVLLKVRPRTLRDWRFRRIVPFIKIDKGSFRYDAGRVMAALAKNYEVKVV